MRKRYHTASEDCNALGGVLGTPTSKDENDELRDYVRQSIGPDEQAWLGINDMVTEGTWIDQTSSSITYKNWDTSNFRSPQPDGSMSQNCAVLSAASQGKWFDENCRDEKPSVCQFNIVWPHLSHQWLCVCLVIAALCVCVYSHCNAAFLCYPKRGSSQRFPTGFASEPKSDVEVTISCIRRCYFSQTWCCWYVILQRSWCLE